MNKELETEVKVLRKALDLIHNEGKVCDSYETCSHIACASSYTSWAYADQALSIIKELRKGNPT